MSSLPEALLARITTPDRAAAVYGDLTELATTRGRFWFWIAYARTLISLGWRAPAALLVAIASVMIMWRVYPMWMQHAVRHLPAQWQVGMFYGQLAVVSGPFLNMIAFSLWFALPFAWMRFGRRDRLTQFACILFFSTLPVLSFRVWLVDASSIATIVVLLTALFSSRWRMPLVVLTLTSSTAIAAIIACFRLLAIEEHQAFKSFSPAKSIGWLTTAFALTIAAFVCSLLHGRLLQDRIERPTENGPLLNLT